MGLQLRYLQTLAEIAGENNSTTIFPLPLDLVKPLLDAAQGLNTPPPPTAAASDSPPPAAPASDSPPDGS